MIFLDIRNGVFSDVLGNFEDVVQNNNTREQFVALITLRDVRKILESLPLGDIRYPGKKPIQKFTERVRQKFLPQAADHFLELLDDGLSQNIFSASLQGRFQAIRCLRFSLDMARESGDEDVQEKLTKLEKKHAKRVVAVGGTVGNVSDISEDFWEEGRRIEAFESLQAGIVWHQTARISAGTEIMSKKFKTFGGTLSEELLERSRAAETPMEAEKLAVLGLKTYAASHGVFSPSLLDVVWKTTKKSLTTHLDALGGRLPELARLPFSEALIRLDGSVWFLPQELEKTFEETHTRLRDSLGAKRATAIQEISRSSNDFFGTIKILDEGRKELEEHPGAVALLEQEKSKRIAEGKEVFLAQSRHEVKFASRMAILEKGRSLLTEWPEEERRLAREMEEVVSRKIEEILKAAHSAPDFSAKERIVLSGREEMSGYLPSDEHRLAAFLNELAQGEARRQEAASRKADTIGGNVSPQKEAPRLKAIVVGLGWDAHATDGQALDLDASAFILGRNGKVRNDSDFVFYNNRTGADGAVQHQGDNLTGEGEGDDEQILMNFADMPADINKVSFSVTIHDAEQRKQNFGQIKNAFMRVCNAEDNTEIARYDLSDDNAAMATAMIFGEIYRHDGEWKFRAIGQGFVGGLGPLASSFGVDIG